MSNFEELLNIPYINKSFFKNTLIGSNYQNKFNFYGADNLEIFEHKKNKQIFKQYNYQTVSSEVIFSGVLSYSERISPCFIVPKDKIFVFKEDKLRITLNKKIEVIRPKNFLDKLNIDPSALSDEMELLFYESILDLALRINPDFFKEIKSKKKKLSFNEVYQLIDESNEITNKNLVLNEFGIFLSKKPCDLTIYRDNLLSIVNSVEQNLISTKRWITL